LGERISLDGFEGGVVAALNSFSHSDTPLEADLHAENPLPTGAVALCILAASLLCWAVILVPLWVAFR
jgi:hypothetical protein